MSPPIRPRDGGHQEALWASLQSGLVSSVGTDHCPFTMEQKRMGKDNFTLIPNGGNGLEERLALHYTYGVQAGKITLEQMVDQLSTAPARIFGLYPRKGTVTVGADADLVVYDPSGERTLTARQQISKSDRNIFEGFKVQGKPSYVVVNGRVQYDNGNLKVERGAGRFLERKAGNGRPD